MNEKKNLTIEETFALAVQNHKKNNLRIAENLYKEVLRINPNHFTTNPEPRSLKVFSSCKILPYIIVLSISLCAGLVLVFKKF